MTTKKQSASTRKPRQAWSMQLQPIPVELIERRIYSIRNQRVMLDSDLAELYEVETKALIQAMKRNAERFPEDFMFQLTDEEAQAMRSQFVTASKRNIRFAPYAFTEQGVAMLSSVLRSKRAVQVNINIMRAFVQLRSLFSTHEELARKLDEMEKKYDAQFKVVFDALRHLMKPPVPARRQIGFIADDGKDATKIAKPKPTKSKAPTKRKV